MQKKKLMILIAVILGTTTSVDVPLAMDNKNGTQQNDPVADNVEQRNGVVPLVNFQRERVADVQAYPGQPSLRGSKAA